jgi:hypothetical protein
MTTDRPIAVVLAALLLVSAASPGFVGTAAAHHESDDNPLDDILADDGETADRRGNKLKSYVPDYALSGASAFDGKLRGFYSGALSMTPFGDDPASNKEQALTFTNEVRIHEETYTAFLSNETNLTANESVHKITVAHEASAPYTVYVVGEIDAENDTVTAIETYAQDEFDESSRDVDAEWVVVGQAARDLPDLTANLAQHIEDGKAIDRSKQAQLAGQYCDFSESIRSDSAIETCDIRSSLWMDHDKLYEGVDMEGDQ